MGARLTLLTAGHVATCPRMVKAADALSEAGHEVHVISTSFVSWARQADDALAAERPWRWTRIDFERAHARGRWMRTALASRIAGLLARGSTRRIPHRVAVRAYAPYHTELVRRATAEPADLVYGGTAGGVHAAGAAARRLGVPFGVDLEDFHIAEQGDGPSARRSHALAERLLRQTLPRAAFRTVAGRPIGDAFERHFGVSCIPINNVFPLGSMEPPPPNPTDALRLYWFSQTLGPGRGLEDLVAAVGRAQVPVQLALRGRALPGYIEHLRQESGRAAPTLTIVAHPPGAPDAMVTLCQEHDVGLALEQTVVPNRDICLTNKLFAFIAAGRPIIGTATTAQRPILESLGPGAKLVAPGDVSGLAEAIREWWTDRAGLADAGARVARAARERWHWEHPDERDRLVRTVERALR